MRLQRACDRLDQLDSLARAGSANCGLNAGAADTFRGAVDPSIRKECVLTVPLLKHRSDVWKDHPARYEEEHSGPPT